MTTILIILMATLLVLLIAKPKCKKNTDLPPSPKPDTPHENSTYISYEGTGHITQRIYRIDAQFYPDQEKCILTFEDEPYELKGYQIGSEYEYKNDKCILRVKENGAVLVFPKGRLLHLETVIR